MGIYFLLYIYIYNIFVVVVVAIVFVCFVFCFFIPIDFCIESWNIIFPPVLKFTEGIFLTTSS